jgi:hypothetical protein
VDVRKRGDAHTSFERRTAGDEDAPGVAVGVVVSMLAPRRVLALLELLACGDHPSGFGDGDHRRDAVIVLEVQALGKVFPAVDLYMWHAAKFLDQADVIVAAINH